MFGAFGGSFWEGWQRRGDELLTQRQRAAEAFNQFKSQNPTASYADYQAFIRQYAGDDYMLRGSFPAEEILQRLGEEGEKKKRQQEQLANAQVMQARLQEREGLNTILREGLRQGIRDPEKLISFGLTQYGIQDPESEQRFRDSFSAFNVPSEIERFDREEADSILKGAMPLIEAGAIGNEKSLDARIPEYFRQSPQFEALRNSLTNSLKTARQARESDAFARVLQLASFADDIDPQQLMPLARRVAGDDASIEEVNAVFGSLYKRAQAERARIEADRARQLRAQEAQIAQAREEARRQQIIALVGNPVLASFVSNGDAVRARRFLSSVVGIGDKATQDQILGGVRDILSGTAQATVPQRTEQALVGGQRILMSPEMFGPKGKLHGSIPNLGASMQYIGRSFVVSPDAAAALHNYVAQNQDDFADLSASELTGKLASFLKQSGAQTVSEYSRTLGAQAMSAGRPQPFREFYQEAKSDITSVFRDPRSSSSVMFGATSIASLPPERRQNAYRNLVNAATIQRNEIISDLQAQAKNYETYNATSGITDTAYSPEHISRLIAETESAYREAIAAAKRSLDAPNPNAALPRPQPSADWRTRATSGRGSVAPAPRPTPRGDGRLPRDLDRTQRSDFVTR